MSYIYNNALGATKKYVTKGKTTDTQIVVPKEVNAQVQLLITNYLNQQEQYKEYFKYIPWALGGMGVLILLSAAFKRQ